MWNRTDAVLSAESEAWGVNQQVVQPVRWSAVWDSPGGRTQTTFRVLSASVWQLSGTLNSVNASSSLFVFVRRETEVLQVHEQLPAQNAALHFCSSLFSLFYDLSVHHFYHHNIVLCVEEVRRNQLKAAGTDQTDPSGLRTVSASDGSGLSEWTEGKVFFSSQLTCGLLMFFLIHTGLCLHCGVRRYLIGCCCSLEWHVNAAAILEAKSPNTSLLRRTKKSSKLTWIYDSGDEQSCVKVHAELF